MKGKQKTAIRQLIEKLKLYRDAEIHLHTGSSGLNFAINEAQSLEPVDEQYIKDAYVEGYSDSALYEPDGVRGLALNYFNETFEKP